MNRAFEQMDSISRAVSRAGMLPALERMDATSRAVSRAGLLPALDRMDAVSRAVSRAGMLPALERMDATSRAISGAAMLPALDRMDAISRAVASAGVLPRLERFDAVARAAAGAGVRPALERVTAWLDEVEQGTVARIADIDVLFSKFGEASAFVEVIDLDEFETAFAPGVAPEEAECAEWAARFVVYYYAAFTAVLVASTAQSHTALKSAIEWMMLASLVYGVIVKKFKL